MSINYGRGGTDKSVGGITKDLHLCMGFIMPRERWFPYERDSLTVPCAVVLGISPSCGLSLQGEHYSLWKSVLKQELHWILILILISKSSPSQVPVRKRSLEKSQWRVDKLVLLLKESIAIETLQYQYTGRTLKTIRVKDMSCLSGFDHYCTFLAWKVYEKIICDHWSRLRAIE